MFTVKLKDGKSYKVTQALAESMQDSIEKGHERIVYHDNLNGAFTIKISDIESIG